VHGAQRINLGPLPDDEAHALLRQLIGPRVDTESDAAAALADGCARLPLALRVAAELAASRPVLSLTDMVGEFADHQRRLDMLDAGGDPRADIRAVFSWSLKHLPPDTARAFRRVGLHPGTDADIYASAALMAASLSQAHRTLNRLTRAHLVHPMGQGRYGMHDLLRAYAISLAAEDDADSRDATGRLLDHYLATAATAMERVYPAEAHTRPRVPEPANAIPTFADRAAARDWLDAERPNLVAAVVHAAGHGWPDHAFQLSRVLFRYLRGGHHADALTINDRTRRLARQLGNRTEEAHALIGLGTARLRTAEYGSATESFERALDLFREAGDQLGEATALYNLGVIQHRGLSRYGDALQYLHLALALFREVGDPTAEASVLNNLGIIERRLGHLELAADYQQQAVALSRKIGDDCTEAYALNSLGLVEELLGRYDCAMDHLTTALHLFHEAGDRCGVASALDNIGTVHTRLGRHDNAQECFTQALSILRQIRNRDGEAWALNSIGEAARASGRPHDAAIHHTEALAVATEIGALDQQARAHSGIGHVHHILLRPRQARDHLEQALRLYLELESPDAEHVRAQLAILEA
jgi:tetratricopeptide (TPR) repeat protein